MTDGWVTFDAPLEVLQWGRSAYPVVRVPAQLDAACRAERTRRVEGRVEDVEVNLGLNRADVVDDAFLYAGPWLQRRLGEGPGAVVRCRLRPVDPDVVPVPDDVRAALQEAGRLAAFEARRPAERRQLLHAVETAVQEATRRRRIARLVDDLAQNGSVPPPPQHDAVVAPGALGPLGEHPVRRVR